MFTIFKPAWRMAARDNWIGWNDEQRKRNLQKIICNSRFLIFPWVRVKNLASSVLALAVKKVPGDWYECYGYGPVLMETLVDQNQFKGTCYKAANWIYVGQTTGRGRIGPSKQTQGRGRQKYLCVSAIEKISARADAFIDGSTQLFRDQLSFQENQLSREIFAEKYMID